MIRPSKLSGIALAILAAAALLAGATGARADQKSLLTPDGTLYTVQSGLYGTLEPQGMAARPTDYVIEWTSSSQSGFSQSGVIPGTSSSEVKDQIDLAYDSLSRSLFLVWNDRFPMLNNIQFAILQSGIWTQSQLLPSGAFTLASNPKILITHQTIQTTANGGEVDSPRSIVSIVWWEDSGHPRARYAPIFIEQGGVDFADVQIYDLPALIGSPQAASSFDLNYTVYQNPSLQADGLTSTILATFADAATGNLQTIHLSFPTDLRNTPNPSTPQGRGHVIVIFSHGTVPLPGSVPDGPERFGTIIGGGYRPTMFWQNDSSGVQFINFDGAVWSNPLTVLITPTLDADKAIALIRNMAFQN